MSTTEPSSFQTRISKCLSDTRHLDITLVASDGAPFPAHLVILDTCTPFFTQPLATNFAEAATKIVSLPEHTKDVVAEFLTLCYTGGYNEEDDARLDVKVFTPLDYVVASQDVKRIVVSRLKMDLDKGMAEKGDEFWSDLMPEIVSAVHAADTPAWK